MKTKLASLFFVSAVVFGFSVVFGQGEATSGKERVKEKLPFTVGGINTLWAGGDNIRDAVRIWLWNNPGSPLCCSRKYSPATFKLNPEKLQYAFPEETEMKDIDPTIYEYKNEYSYPQYPIRMVNGKPTPSRWVKSDAVIPVDVNQIVLLKLGNKYVAIKPLVIEPRYRSLEEMSPRMQEQWRHKGPDGIEMWKKWRNGKPPYSEWLTYEWRYWDNPTPRPKPAVASVEAQLRQIGLTAEEARRLVER